MKDYKCSKCGNYTTNKGRDGGSFVETTTWQYGKKEIVVKCKCGNIVRREGKV